MSLKSKLSILFSLLALIPLLLTSYLSFQNDRDALIRKTAEQLISVAEIQETRINEALDRYLEQSKLVTSRTQLRKSIAAYNADGGPEERDQIQQIIEDARDAVTAIKDIDIANPEGIIIASTNKEDIGTDIADQSYFEDGMKVHKLTDVYKDKRNVLRTRLVGPFISNNVTVGVAVLTADADPIISITEDHTGTWYYW